MNSNDIDTLSTTISKMEHACTKDERRAFFDALRHRAESIYGNPLPMPIEKRLAREWQHVKFRCDWLFIPLLRVGDFLREKRIPVCADRVGSLFIIWLMGLSEINPLPPHYVCKVCHHTDFEVPKTIRTGLDLSEKRCPRCGNMLWRDGFNISYDFYFGWNDSFGSFNHPRVELATSEEAIEPICQIIIRQIPKACWCYFDPNYTGGGKPDCSELFLVPRGDRINKHLTVWDIAGVPFSIDRWGYTAKVASIGIERDEMVTSLDCLAELTGIAHESIPVWDDVVRNTLVSDAISGKRFSDKMIHLRKGSHRTEDWIMHEQTITIEAYFHRYRARQGMHFPIPQATLYSKSMNDLRLAWYEMNYPEQYGKCHYVCDFTWSSKELGVHKKRETEIVCAKDYDEAKQKHETIYGEEAIQWISIHRLDVLMNDL